ncbi:MAG: HEAT repeat domain-containing protein, partial [Phycisphaerae bacterium]
MRMTCCSRSGLQHRLKGRGAALVCVAAALTLLAAGCEGPRAKVDVNRWIKDLVFPPSTAERVIAVQSPLADRRREALQEIVEDKKARQVESVVKLYCLVARTDADPMVRSAAVRGLAVLKGEAVVPTLCHVLETDKSGYVRSDAAAALGRHETPSAMEALVDALASDASTDVRVAAAESLRRFQTKRAAGALADALDCRDIAVAHSAWRSLRYMTGQDLPRETEPWTQF